MEGGWSEEMDSGSIERGWGEGMKGSEAMGWRVQIRVVDRQPIVR